MLQPLYLDGAERPLAVLREGPALRLRREAAADVFMPLPRLARVVVHGARVQWRTEALLACMEAGVPVVFLGTGDAASGVCVPLRPPAQRIGLALLLDAASTRPGFVERLENLARAWERQAILALVAAAQLPAADLRPAVMRAACLARMAGGAAGGDGLRALLQGACTALVLEALARRQIGSRFLATSTGGFDLAGGLVAVLGWTLWPALWRLADYLQRHAAKHDRPALVRQRAVRAFEAEVPRLEKALAALLGRLAAELAEETP